MKLIVDIPEETYKEVTWRGLHLCPRDEHALVDAIKNGTPLPKGHGRLIDVDEVIKIANKTKDLHGTIWNAPTIIEADTESEE